MTEAKPLVIAIDGPAAAGKGTLARRLAEFLALAHLDTGTLYRAVGLGVLKAGLDPADPEAALRAAIGLRWDELMDPDLRGDAAANAASTVAAIPSVREALMAFQRDFAARPPAGSRGVVLDGRDIGSVICPEAPVKLFVTASLHARATRRLRELRSRGHGAIHSRVLREMQERDARDVGRAAAPLRPAEDASVIDSSELDEDTVFAVALDVVRARTGS